MIKRVTKCRWVIIAAIATALTLGLVGSASANDFIWTNADGDRDYNNAANWDEYQGSCQAFIGSGTGIPASGSHWAVIDTEGDPIRCTAEGNPRPEGPPADQGPINYSTDGSAGAYGALINNTLTLQPNTKFSVSNTFKVGSGVDGSGTSGAVIINSGAECYGGGGTCYLGDVGPCTLTIDGGQFGSQAVVRVGGANTLNGGTGTVTITNGGIFTGRYIAIGAGGHASLYMQNGTIESDNWFVIGGELNAIVNPNHSIATMTMDDGYIRACDNSGNFWVGDGGKGTLTQNGGLIEIDDAGGNYPMLGLAAGLNSEGTVNLNGGMLYTKGFPNVNDDGEGALAVINIDGGKLGTRDYTTAQADLQGLITSGKIKGTGGSTNLADFHIIQIPAGMTKYKDSGTPQAIWVVSSPPAACDFYVGPYDQTDLIMQQNDSPFQIEYTVGNYGATTSLSYNVSKDPDEAWVSLDKTSGSAAAGGGLDTVTATVNPSSLTPGTNYTMDLVFTNDCNTTQQETRTITLFVQRWATDPPQPDTYLDIGVINAYLNCINPQTYTITVINQTPDTFNYTVEQTDENGSAVPPYPWLSLDKTGGGPLAQGESDTVTITLTGTGHGPEYRADQGTPTWDARWEGWLKFTTVEFGDVLMRHIIMSERRLGALFGHVRYYCGEVYPYLSYPTQWEPGDDGPCGAGCRFVPYPFDADTETFGTVVVDNTNPDPDYNADDGYALLVDQTGTGTDLTGRHMWMSNVDMGDNGGWNDHANPRFGSTMVARLKVETASLMGANMWMPDNNDWWDEGPRGGARVEWNSNNRVREYINDILTPNLGRAKPTAYHTVRITRGYGGYGQPTIKVWVDGASYPDPVLTISPAQGGTGVDRQAERPSIGVFGNSSASKVYFDWMSFTNAGMYGPGEEVSCLGVSLIPDATICTPACNDPFADHDEDGDVDQDDFAEFQLCYTGDGDPGGIFDPDNCKCFDKEPSGGDDDVDENDFNPFQNCAATSGPKVPADITCDDGL
ncbi:MAG: hypothetical protein JSV03_10930 [Planctomycetota bacterium]|nr:MAG: hypothetical protein JSV03_10930 [Planctomycetota bacterium]